MLRKILNFRVLYRATPLFSFAIHTKYPKINHSPLRGSICSEIKSILHMKKGGQYLPECQLCDIQKLMIFDSKWGVSLVRNIQKAIFLRNETIYFSSNMIFNEIFSLSPVNTVSLSLNNPFWVESIS